MLDLILIILLIISLFKPDILLAKKMRDNANDEQKAILVKNLRKIYVILIGFIESIALIFYESIMWGAIVSTVIFVILFFVISLPAVKQNSKIVKEVNGKQ